MIGLAACSDGPEELPDPPPPANAVASAGEDQLVSRGVVVSLDGSGSADPDGDALTYTWTQVAGPDVTEGTGTLGGESPTFVAPNDVATLVFELRVHDGNGDSEPDTVQINVLEDVNVALFVAGDIGDDESGNGAIDTPFASIGRALSVVTDAQQDIYVMTRAGGGRYDETGATLSIPAGTSLYGGYDAGWHRDPVANKTGVDTDHRGFDVTGEIDFDTSISGFDLITADSPSAGEDVIGLSAAGGSATLYLRDNSILAGDVAAGQASEPGTSYGVQLRDIFAVEIIGNTIAAGRGGDGAAGTAGGAGSPGANGADATGSGRAAGGDSSGDGGTGGQGGERGGGLGGGGGGDGGDGEFASGNQGRGGSGGGGTGDAGTKGTNGSDGETGDRGRGFGGSLAAQVFVPARGSRGASGEPGGGGGGGGGGGASRVGRVGGGGGGGGQGGGGGEGGQGGQGGGASVGIWLFGVTDSAIEDNTVSTADGGSGAPGGTGGSGGQGGAGGVHASGDCGRFTCGSDGGDGGDGGSGGGGGSGGSGGGGPSFGIYFGPEIGPSLNRNTVSAGAGGEGGSSDSSTGEGGWSFAIFDADTQDGIGPALIDNELVAGTPGTEGQAGRKNF